MSHVGYLLQAQGTFAESESFWREAVERGRRVLGDEHEDTQSWIDWMARVLQAQGKLTEAESLRRELLETSRRLRGEHHADTLVAMRSLGGLLVRMGRHREAVELLSPAEAAMRSAFTGADLAPYLRTLGRAYAGLGEPRELPSAEAKLQDAHAIFAKVRGATHKDARDTAQSLVELYEAWHAAEPGRGHDQKAAEWKAKLAPPAAEPKKDAPR
jgi:tetratricopeptide (TPR) repeat protein